MACKVCMFVYNNFTHDSRVLKEASTLSNAGYDVRVIALLDNYTIPYEQINGFRIIRVEKNPLHLKFLRFFNSFRISALFICLINLFKKHNITKSTSMNKLGYTKYSIKKKLNGLLAQLKDYNFNNAINNLRTDHPYLFIILGWLFLLIYKLFKICLHFASILKDAIYWGIKRSTRIFWYRYVKKAYYWGVKRPFKIIKSKCYYKLKNLLMKFHRPFCFLDYYLRAYRVVLREPANIYHAHDLNTLPVAFWVSRRHAAKLVYDSHELYVDRNQLRPPGRIGKFVLKRLESYYIRRSSAVITVNEAIADELAKRYKVNVPNVVMNTPSEKKAVNSTNDNLLRKALGVNEKYNILLYCGVMTFNRGLDKVIRSMEYLPHHYLIFMGYGTDEYKSYLQKVASEAKIQDRFSFFGPVPSEEVTMYATGADLGVAPIENACLSYYYCSPNKVFEYISAGLPVIGSNFPELKRVIHTYEIGCTFEPSDPADIARAAREVLGNREQWIKMKQNTSKAAKEFNWEKESRKLLDLYYSVS